MFDRESRDAYALWSWVKMMQCTLSSFRVLPSTRSTFVFEVLENAQSTAIFLFPGHISLWALCRGRAFGVHGRQVTFGSIRVGDHKGNNVGILFRLVNGSRFETVGFLCCVRHDRVNANTFKYSFDMVHRIHGNRFFFTVLICARASWPDIG